jgi:phosphonate transport system substrate-binding protein
MAKPIIVGTVLYDPKVFMIWDIIRAFFDENGCPIEVRFYNTYESQVQALLNRSIDIAWNSPLAWIDAQQRSGSRCRAIAMRDTDRDRISHFVVRNDDRIRGVEDLRGTTLAVGAVDSPQATLIPIGFLHGRGLEQGRDYQVKRFDILVGKHGDHIGGELAALQALADGEADVCVMLDLNCETWTLDGTINPDAYRILTSTDRFDHCVFTVRDDFPPEAERQWLDVLFSMRYDYPTHREMMDLEGLKQWLPGRTTGFEPLADAVARQRFFKTE